MAEITAVAFKEGGKVYYFAPGNGEYKKGMGVIVETARGVEYAKVVIPRAEVGDDKIVSPLKPILRIATAKDEETNRKNLERRESAMETVREKVEAHGLEMKLVDCEFAFDGSKAVFYYTAPKRVDFRELVKDLSSYFRMRIELRQVGLRDEIQLLGGLAPCGRECCCSSCLPDIKKVSIKMAKNQGLSLNPTKISGLCGRLMCCLAYENDYYQDACKCMPKIGSEVGTPEGNGTVVNVNMLKMLVRVKIEDKSKDLATYKDFSVDELKFRRACKSEEDEEEDIADESEVIEEKTEAVEEERPAERREGGKKHRNNPPKENGQNKQGGHKNKPRRPNENAKKPASENPQNSGSAEQGAQKNRKNNKKRFHGKKNGAKAPEKAE